MAKKKLTEQQEKEIKMLLASNEMLQKSKEEAKLRGNTESVRLIDVAQQDTIEQIRRLDANVANDVVNSNSNNNSDTNDLYRMLDTTNETVYDTFKKVDIESNPIANEKIMSDVVENNTYEENDGDFNLIDSNVQYDIIPLPSKGECYKGKYDRIAVSYLTAYDENLITSPNLYKDGLVIDFLLKHKVLDKSINVDELCSGDVDAITLFLRATSYGPEFPIIVRDPKSGEQIETTVDLSELKIKEFTLVGDENGHFEFTLPVSKDVVKFRYLTRKDEKMLDKLAKLEDNGVKAFTVKEYINNLVDAIKTDKILSGAHKQEYSNNLAKMNDWVLKLSEKSPLPFNKSITNRLELSITAINGNYDKKFISNYVRNMGVRDSLMLRRYILQNEPGVNFEITVERPESLGGGSFKTFLEWDDSIFLNIA